MRRTRRPTPSATISIRYPPWPHSTSTLSALSSAFFILSLHWIQFANGHRHRTALPQNKTPVPSPSVRYDRRWALSPAPISFPAMLPPCCVFFHSQRQFSWHWPLSIQRPASSLPNWPLISLSLSHCCSYSPLQHRLTTIPDPIQGTGRPHPSYPSNVKYTIIWALKQWVKRQAGIQTTPPRLKTTRQGPLHIQKFLSYSQFSNSCRLHMRFFFFFTNVTRFVSSLLLNV